MTTIFKRDKSNLGFGVFTPKSPWDWGLVFQLYENGWDNAWKAESYSGSRSGPQGFLIERDQNGNNIMTGQNDGYLDL